MKKYLLILAVLVVVAVLGTIGGMAFATGGGNDVSNPLTLNGRSSFTNTAMTLTWANVDNGNPNGEVMDVTWVVGNEYTVNLTAKNNTAQPISNIYGKITGWNPEKFKIVYTAAKELDSDGVLGHDVFCGFWVGTGVDAVYYFGPANTGDSYIAGDERSFVFEVTPLLPSSIDIQIVLVDSISAEDDPR